jgi:hypothetical protein
MEKSNVFSIVGKIEGEKQRNVIDTLNLAIERTKASDSIFSTADKILIICVDDSGDAFDVGILSSNMRYSDGIAACELTKKNFMEVVQEPQKNGA